jgi:hypothetical protein
MLATSACGPTGRLRARQALSRVLWHPFATVLALLLVPMAFIVVELVFLFITRFESWHALFLCDTFPTSTASRFVPVTNVPLPLDPVVTPSSVYDSLYIHGLRRGYTLVGAITASLFRGIHTRVSPSSIRLTGLLYLGTRILCSALFLTVIAPSLQLQARWLGLIASVDPVATSPSLSP